jgi:hypothetical protein
MFAFAAAIPVYTTLPIFFHLFFTYLEKKQFRDLSSICRVKPRSTAAYR